MNILNIIIFVLNYLTVLVSTKQLLFTSVSVVSGGYLPLPPPLQWIIVQYLFLYITESASEQDEANPVFWLAPWAGKVGPYYCACVSPIKKLSCRDRVKQLLHFGNKINVITKFKYLQDFTKILWWAVKWGAVKHWKHRLPTNVLIRLLLFDRNFAKCI